MRDESRVFSHSSAAGGSLGTSGQSSSHEENPPVLTLRDAAKKARYRLKRRARELLPEEYGKVFGECSRVPVPEAAYVVGRYNPADQTSTYAGLVHCDSYACPLCAYRRSEEDRHELSVALAQAAKLNLFPVLITGTMRHHMGDALDELRVALGVTFNDTFSGRWYDDLCKEYGIVGKLKAWEVTFGKNGWHPHLHILMVMESELADAEQTCPSCGGVALTYSGNVAFCRSDGCNWQGHQRDLFQALSLSEFENRLKERWLAMLAKHGFDASWEHGLDVRTAQSDIADYIAKWGREPVDMEWGADAEIAKSPVKKAHRDGLTPFEILAAADGDPEPLERLCVLYEGESREQVIERAGKLYREYFYAFKGKPRLYWGKLKEVLQLDQALQDFAAANPTEVETVDMVLIEARTEWGKLLKIPDGLPDLLAVIRTGDAFKVLDWLGRHNIHGVVSPAALERSALGEAT